MARRAELHPEREHEHDAWSEAWGDRALQDLGRRLVSYGVDEENAALIVEQTWLFYSYVALPRLQRRLPMGIATKYAEPRPAIFLYIGPRAHEVTLERFVSSETMANLQETFARDFASPLADQVNLTLESVWTPVEWAKWLVGGLESLEYSFRQLASRQHLDYVGMFVDDLEAELRTIMEPELVPTWLNTPNLLLNGHRPAEFLHDPLDRQLRGVITRAKFNLPAA